MNKVGHRPFFMLIHLALYGACDYEHICQVFGPLYNSEYQAWRQLINIGRKYGLVDTDSEDHKPGSVWLTEEGEAWIREEARANIELPEVKAFLEMIENEG